MQTNVPTQGELDSRPEPSLRKQQNSENSGIKDRSIHIQQNPKELGNSCTKQMGLVTAVQFLRMRAKKREMK